MIQSAPVALLSEFIGIWVFLPFHIADPDVEKANQNQAYVVKRVHFGKKLLLRTDCAKKWAAMRLAPGLVCLVQGRGSSVVSFEGWRVGGSPVAESWSRTC